MKKFAILTAVLALGTLSLSLAKPIVPKEQEKPKGPPAVDHLAPKMVNLNLDNVSVFDAVNELTRQSGYPIQLQGDLAVLRSRMITLKTGAVSFFQALDMLCRKGNLVEVNNGLMVRPLPPNPGFGPNVQPAPGGAQAVPGVAPGAQIKIQVQVQPNGGIQIQPEPKADPQPVPAPQPKAKKGAKGGRLQAQVQQGKAQAQQGNAQVQPAAKIQPRPIVRPNQIVLADGKPAELPTFYAGAVRIRMLSPVAMNMPVQPGETLLVFELTPEPRLQSFNVVGTPTITKALDDVGQSLSVVVEAPANVPGVLPAAPQVQPLPAQALPAQLQPGIAQPMIMRPNFGLARIVTVRLKAGAKEAKQIKELNGTVNVQVMGQPETVLKIDNVLQGKAQSAKSKDNNVRMILDSMEKAGDLYRAQVIMEYATKANPNAQPNGGAASIIIASPKRALPNLVDADGKVYQMRITGSKYENAKNAGDPIRRIYTIEYIPGAGQGQPASLVVNQSRLVQVPIAFEFANVPVR